MPRHKSLLRRSPREWIIRGSLAIIVAISGYVSVTRSLAQAIAHSNAELAHGLAPEDGRITARLAASLSGAKVNEADRRRADVFARAALWYDAGAVSAVSTLGIDAQLRGDTAKAHQFFDYSQKLSRRDLQTQLWAIEYEVARGDVADALEHYDVALRVSPTMSDTLYPIMATASADPEIRSALIHTLAGKPLWGHDFVYYIAANGPPPRSTAQLFRGLKRAGIIVPQGADVRLTNAFVSAGEIEEGWNYYRGVRDHADRNRSRDPKFTALLEAATAFDWITVNRDSITTTIQSSSVGGVFDFAASPGVGGDLLQQMQLLLPGDYQLIGRSGGIDQGERARPYWVLSCRDNRELGRVVLPNSADGDREFSGRFHVPEGCPVQMLTLVALPSDAVSGTSGQIHQVELAPAR